MLKTRQLEEDDFALALVLSDPIMFPEFLRSTQDADMRHKENWRDFKYRWYQRDLLTDQNAYIVLTGGRSIGKCMIGNDRILTEVGYKSHTDLRRKAHKVWSINEHGDLELRRALAFENGYKRVWRVITEYDDTLTCTNLHPIFCESGYKFARDITDKDRVAMLTKLPHVQSGDNAWQDVRLIGYMLYQIHGYKVTKTPLQIKSQRARLEIREIAKHYGLTVKIVDDGFVFATQKKFEKNPLGILIRSFNLDYVQVHSTWDDRHNRLPEQIMTLNEKDLTLFLEAFCSQYAELSVRSIKIPVPNPRMESQWKELFLRYGIIMRAVDGENTRKEIGKDKNTIRKFNYYVETATAEDAFRFWHTFKVPGYMVDNVSKPLDRPQFEFVKVVKAEKLGKQFTYAVQVEKNNTYIANNVHVHNSLVLEDKVLFDMFNAERQLGDTPELVLTTANQAQMTPILDRLNTRILRSPLLKRFTRSGVNKQSGTLDLSMSNRQIRLYARIAGNKGASNVVGLHVPKAIIDEAQLYPMVSFTELMPAINQWQDEKQVIAAGVPNGMINTVLYRLDRRNRRYKKYRIPAPNNPYFSYKDYVDALRDYGGEEDDRFQTLVLGRHGAGSEQVLTRDQIGLATYPFYSYYYSHIDRNNGISYQQKLERPDFNCEMYIAGIDTGFIDPTVISIFGFKDGKWLHLARYKLQRIESPEQEAIIHWLHEKYDFTRIGIDIGSGGQGPSILQSLMLRSQYKTFRYEKILQGVQFAQNILVGYNENSQEIMQDTKTVGALELVKLIQARQIVFNDLDNEGLSELERIAKQKRQNGTDRYFIASEKGSGESVNDHIFASFICFAIIVRDVSFLKKKKKLGRTIG